MKIALVIIGLLLVLIGVVCVFDARNITTKRFSFQDINEGTKFMKIAGLIAIIGGFLLVYFSMPEAIGFLKNI